MSWIWVLWKNPLKLIKRRDCEQILLDIVLERIYTDLKTVITLKGVSRIGQLKVLLKAP